MQLHLRTARLITDLLDNQFEVGKFKFGFDPVIGAIPGLGDLFTLSLSLYIVWIGIRLRLPQEKIIEMVGNVIMDFVIGLLPLVGDLTDFIFKANSRNMKIIENYANNIIEGDIVQPAQL